MFYSSMATIYGQFYSTREEFRQTRDVPQLVASLALIWLIPAVMEEVIRGRAPGGEEARRASK